MLESFTNLFSHDYWFGKTGIQSKDIPKALIYFKTMSYTSYLLIFGLSYRYRFSSKLLKSDVGKATMDKIEITFPNAMAKVKESATKILSYLAQNKYIKQIPERLGLNTKRFSKALVETTVIYKLSLPLYFYGTYKLIKSDKSKNKNE